MNTPAHLILGAAIFARPDAGRVTAAALVGAFLPDASLYLMAGVAIFGMGISPDVVFRDLYFSDAWQQVFAVDNSFILWGIGLGAALWCQKSWVVALCGAALVHIAFDFPLHNEDARMHFWPLSDWKFHSPISYWDSSSGGTYVGVLELLLVITCTFFLIRRFRTWGWRSVFVGLAALQVLPFFAWALFF